MTQIGDLRPPVDGSPSPAFGRPVRAVGTPWAHRGVNWRELVIAATYHVDPARVTRWLQTARQRGLLEEG